MKINLETTFCVGSGAETNDLLTLEDQKGEEFEYLVLKVDKEDRQENYIKNRINKGKAVTAMLNCVEQTVN